MHDQAESLRTLLRSRHIKESPKEERKTRIITITSGKGGVGKSNFTLNFAITLQSYGYKVLVFDADIGMANIDVLMGIRPEYNLYHLMKREKKLEDIIYEGTNGLRFVAGGSGFRDLLQLSEADLDYFADEVNRLNGEVDFIIFDTGAGLSKETIKFIVAAEETIVVTTPEPTAITDAYAVIKMVHQMNEDVLFQLMINRVTDRKEGIETAEKIRLTAKRFLNLDIPILGFVPDDVHVVRSVKMQIPFTIAYPHSSASKGIQQLVQTFLNQNDLFQPPSSGIQRFMQRMIRLLK